MITATFDYTEKVYSFSVIGHAEYAEQGKDIVCASVSSLSTMIANEVLNRCDNAICRVEDGLLSCQVDLNKFEPAESYHISSLFEMLEMNLKEIKKQYPENLMVLYDTDSAMWYD